MMTIDKGKIVTLEAPDGRRVEIRLEVNPRARRLILRLDDKARQGVAIAPSKHQLDEAAKFALARVKWIADHLASLPDRRPFAAGTTLPLRGKPCQLSADGPGRMARLELGPPQVLRLPGDPDTFSARAERYLKKAAKADLTEAVHRHTQTLTVTPTRISVKDTRSRWGSCTSDGRLSFSWRLIFAPSFVLDYVAAHECAHLLEMNHSPQFWQHVARCIPDWKSARTWLRKEGRALHALG